MNDDLLTIKQVAQRWKQCRQTIDRYRKIGLLPWIDLSGGKSKRAVVRFRLSDIEEYEEKMRMHPVPSYKKAKPQHQKDESAGSDKSKNLRQPLSLSDESPKLIRRFSLSE